MYIPRYCDDIESRLQQGKVLVIFGPRQVGKTTAIKSFLAKTALKYRFDTGDNLLLHPTLNGSNFKDLLDYASGYELIIIDEAQKIPGIGHGLKILADHKPGIKILVTGSSSFELAGQIGEPLTGRKSTLFLYPVSHMELLRIYNPFDLKSKLEEFMIFGSYPEVLTQDSKEKKIRLLEELTGSYLLKDILSFEQVKSSKLLIDLLRLLAYQVGSEVSHSELAKKLGINYKTVSRYLDLLEKTFVIYNVRGYSNNLRTEITKKSKYYFFDNGIRNTLIANYNPITTRNDVGALWENFLMMERLKFRAYTELAANPYFWRTWDQKEIDLIEERGGSLYAFEFKWTEKAMKKPKDFLLAYPGSTFTNINQGNYLDFIISSR